MKELAWSSRDLERAFVQSTWLCIRAFVWPRAGSSWHPRCSPAGHGEQTMYIEHGAWLWAEFGGSTLSLPASQEVQEQSWSSLGAPSSSWCDHSWCSPAFRQPHQHPTDLPSSSLSGEQTLNSWGRCHLHRPQPAHSSTHPPLVERVPFPGTHPNHSNIPLTLYSFFQGSSDALPISMQLPDNSSR